VVTTARLDFALPPALEAGEPPEARGGARDQVRLMVARRSCPELVHATFRSLPDHLAPGDLLVVNTSATIPAAFDARGTDGTEVVVHLSTNLAPGLWVVEPRRRLGGSSVRWTGSAPPTSLRAGRGATLELIEPYLRSERLWTARVRLGRSTLSWLAAHGRPIRYAYVTKPWPLSAYQTVFSEHPGSAEMPSAARPFTPRVVARLAARGVAVSPLVLHTGVASFEAGELPYPERVVVPSWTAARVNATRAAGGRVVAVGTTVVRALESAARTDGQVEALDDWTDLVVTPERGVRVVDGILTGWHEPQASHLQLLEAIAGRELLERSYAASVSEGYRWHEFGDSHLVLP
jgi:S-adenosylmethionine:tRNA ribosyltransferase-isomerase